MIRPPDTSTRLASRSAAGGSATVSVQWDTRSTKGTHTLLVTADKTGLVAESNETNNTRSQTVVVQGNKT